MSIQNLDLKTVSTHSPLLCKRKCRWTESFHAMCEMWRQSHTLAILGWSCVWLDIQVMGLSSLLGTCKLFHSDWMWCKKGCLIEEQKQTSVSLSPSKQFFIRSHTCLKFAEWRSTSNWVLCQTDKFCISILTCAAPQGDVQGREAVLPHHVMCTGKNKVREKAKGETMLLWGLVSTLLWTVWFVL